MKRVHIIHDPYKLDESTVADVENPLEYLKSEFKGGFPEHAKIYKGSIAVENDITEKLQKDELLINLIDDDIWVVIWPAWVQILYYAVVALTAALSIYMYLTMPKPQMQSPQSPNNELSSRSNRARLGGRVPDIFGTVRAYPDLISETYTYFDENGVEIERSLLCIGRGYYQINNVRDALTDIEDINGSSISIYDPGTSIIGSTIYRAGREFLDLPLQVVKSSAITGQSLEQPNDTKIDSTDIYFDVGGLIKLRSGSLIDFTTDFSSGDSIVIRNAFFGINDYSLSGNISVNEFGLIVFTSSTNIDFYDLYRTIVLAGALIELTVQDGVDGSGDPIYVDKLFDLSGAYYVQSIVKSGTTYTATLFNPSSVNPAWSSITSSKTLQAGVSLQDNESSIKLDDAYTIKSVTSQQIELNNPELINDDWSKVLSSTIGQIVEIGLDKMTVKWIGWHNIEMLGATRLTGNFTFPQGLYWTSKSGRKDPEDVTIIIEYQQIDDNGDPIGSIYTSSTEIIERIYKPFGRTIVINLPFVGWFRFRISRLNANSSGAVDDCRVKSVYASKVSDISIYDDVTVIQSEAIANDGLYAIKERKLNCLVTRKLPLNGTGALTATKSAAQALIYLALDQKNGRRSINEVDIAQILAEEQAVIDYFGNSKAAEFSYTIDDNNLSFEEIAGMVASSMFCEAYRYGNKLRIRFEQPQQNSILLFNAANKAPNTEKRTKNFGIENKYDGIEIEYTSPDDDTRITYVASDDENPINTMQIKTSGIRSHEQAKTRAWREWNKLKFRNINCEFEALEESELLARNDRILVADNTVVKTKDGIIDSVDGLTLGLSHPIESSVPYFIYLQLADGRVDIVPCSYVDDYTVLLSRPPLIALVPEFTTYQLIESTETPSNAFMVTEIRPQGKMTNMLTCVNYDERYYQNDADFF